MKRIIYILTLVMLLASCSLNKELSSSIEVEVLKRENQSLKKEIGILNEKIDSLNCEIEFHIEASNHNADVARSLYNALHDTLQ